MAYPNSSGSALDLRSVLNVRRLPARLATDETAAILGFQDHDIAPLVAAKLLSPLGRPAKNAPKYYATVEILERAGDPEWLSKATKSLSGYWQEKNRRKSER